MRAFVFLILISSVSAFAQKHDHHGHHKPAAAVQGVISLDVYKDGEAIHVLTAEQKGEAVSLWHRRYENGALTTPVRVDGPGAAPRSVRRGDDAQVAARGDTVLALWSVPGKGWGGSGPLVAAMSKDGGKTWAPTTRPSDTGLATGEGFADLLAAPDGFHAVWLDSRDKAQGLRYARTAEGSRWTPSITIASGTVECCWNTLLRQGDAIHVLYRDKDPRDMALATLKQGAWTKAGSVGGFNWKIKGCPETGGGLALTPDGAMHVLTWTGLEGKTGLYVSANTAQPRRLGTQAAQHGDLASSGQRLAAAWDEDGAIWIAISADEGRTWGAARKLRSDKLATNPRIIPSGDGFLVLWTEPGPGGAHRMSIEKLDP